ncbi:putative GTPase activating protein (Tsc2) [Aspergillus clavatus NRRL 1]|uniref:GTPase activating protein (Tsc2), putative n=1 Tax=Aspergillus clavatus (strain ATCC 1007 / CBS 513.65 / DSM 816 / NCTC 3887 / NRRL 1 / QM 1276 / 107) TaxID=344612 RepID=A1CMB3_ASPCL|nr:GTPase activating protein (Tsc2), putative [Aspergillus clavatus NRRL 1]EAW08700.1 GTPase activating protein (Tsc2), putative [Aspergillus clavatus NRRL 1]
MHRGSVVSSSSDTSGALDFETAIKNLSQKQYLAHAIDEAEHVSRGLQSFNSDQSIALWEAGSYLIHHVDSPDARRSGSLLLETVAARQDLTPAARRTIFESISSSSEPDVIPARVQSLISLSDHGRKLDFTSVSVLSILSSCAVPLYELISSARLKARKAKVGKVNGLGYEESALDNMLQFAVDLITLQRKRPSNEEIESLLEQIFIICKKTSVAADIKNSLAVFDAIILYADVPDGSFIPMLEVLCSIHASVKSLSGPTSRAVRNLARSRRQTEMMNTLDSFLLESSEAHSRNINVLRGAVYVLTDLISAYGQDGMPELRFEHLMHCLEVVIQKDDNRLDADVLELCLNILDGEFVHVALRGSWSSFVRVLCLCSSKAVGEREERAPSISSAQSPISKGSIPEETKSNILSSVVQIAASIESLWERLNGEQKLDATRFLMNACEHMEPSQAELILNITRTEKLCFPSNSDWVNHCHKLIWCFIRTRDKPSDVRILALGLLKEAFSTYETLIPFEEHGLLQLILDCFTDEEDILFLESLVSFVVDASTMIPNDSTFKFLVDTLGSLMKKDSSNTESLSIAASTASSPQRRPSADVVPIMQTSANQQALDLSLSSVCTAGLVKMFLRSLTMSATKVAAIFETLLNIAQSLERPADSRLTVLKLLFRLRCDSSGSIIVVSMSENDFLADTSGRAVDSSSRSQTSSEMVFGDHGTIDENLRPAPQGRQSVGRESLANVLSRSASRSMAAHGRPSILTPPVWTFASSQVLPENPPDGSSPFVYAYTTPDISSDSEGDATSKVALKANMWLETIITLLLRETNWEIYSYVLIHLAPQLSNRDFFRSAVPQIKLLRSVLCDQVKNESFREPPASTGVKKTDVAGYVFDCLSVLVSYHEFFAKSEQDELVRAFMMGIIGSWGDTSRRCVHALSVCCHEIPLSVTKSLNGIFDKMAKVITMSNLAVHILEFLSLLARLPDVYVNLREEEIRTVFGICIRFLQTSREHRLRAGESSHLRNQASARLGSGVREIAVTPAELPDPSQQDGMSTYIYTLTHHVMVFWFLSLKLQDRAKHVNWITSRLIFKDEQGHERVEEQSQVFIDLMQRSAFSDLGETIPYETFPPSPSDGPVIKRSWVVGMSIVTVETAGVSGLTQIAKRQASGTTYAMYQQRTAPVLPHQVPSAPDAHLHPDAMRTAVLPSHVLLQLTTTAFPTPTAMQPIPLPDDDMTRRALSTFDRNDIVDGHKIGVVYIDNGQTTESEILSNTHGSSDYESFLSGLGTKVPLRGAQFNTQGLHPDVDGEFAYAWRDRVTEIVYHVATMMPTDFDRDPACINKKRHIGNDFVNIIFNRSNMPFNFNTIASQFNFINIIISPVCRIAGDAGAATPVSHDLEKNFYTVKVMSKPGLPEISPASAPKVISGKSLAAFVRILALNASVFSLVWNSQGGEHISSWRNRLREIKRLRERALGSQSQASETAEGAYPGQRRNTKANIFSEEVPTRVAPVRNDFATDWNAAADASILQNLDFSRWGR